MLSRMRWPGSASVFDVCPDFSKADLPWVKWASMVDEFTYDRALPYFALVVPTVDTVRFSYIFEAQLERLYPVFFTGLTGTGKTVIVQDYLNRASASDYEGGVQVSPIVLNFSARTPSKGSQLTIEEKMERKKKDLLGPPANKLAVVFVDDVNMPAVEEYGAQPPIELLRQLVDFRGFYDREKLYWKNIDDTVTVAAAAPPGGGRAEVTPRFSRHFHVLCVPPASPDVLKHIFGSILQGFLEPFNEDVRSTSGRVVQATIEVYDKIRLVMRPTPSKSHYTFNLRDVSKVFQGVLMIDKKACPSGDVMARLWAHECSRVFHDRLVSVEDKQWFCDAVMELVKRVLGK